MDYQFKTVPEPVFEAESCISASALQATAALMILTLEDAQEVFKGGYKGDVETPERLLDWARNMREDLLGGYRKEMLHGLGRQKFFTNTHGGFITTPLVKTVPNSHRTQTLFNLIESYAMSLAQGGVPFVEDQEEALLAKIQLDDPCYTKEEVDYVLNSGGRLLLCLAALASLRGSRG